MKTFEKSTKNVVYGKLQGFEQSYFWRQKSQLLKVP